MSEQKNPAVTRKEFLERLRNGIGTLPSSRMMEIEEDIRLHFDEGMAAGEEEGALCAMLGDPDELAQEYVSLYEQEVSGLTVSPVGKTKYNRRGRHPVSKVFIAIGMFFLDICIALPVWIVLGVCWIVLALGAVIAPCGALAILVTLFGLFLPMPWNIMDYPLINFFGGIACIALGGLMIMGAMAYGKYFLKWTWQYVRLQKRIIAGKEG